MQFDVIRWNFINFLETKILFSMFSQNSSSLLVSYEEQKIADTNHQKLMKLYGSSHQKTHKNSLFFMQIISLDIHQLILVAELHAVLLAYLVDWSHQTILRWLSTLYIFDNCAK